MAKKSAERSSKTDKEGVAERTARFMRNVNALGAVAFAGAAVLVPPAAFAFNALAALDAVQAGGFEIARRWAHKKRKSKQA